MNKKKACIESLAALENQEPPLKVSRQGHVSAPHEDISKLTANIDSETQFDKEENVFENKNHEPLLSGCGDSFTSTDFKLQQQQKSEFINTSFFNDKVKTDLANAFQGLKDLYDEFSDVNMNCRPFRHCILSKLISNEELISELESSLLSLPLIDKSNDLYKFSQSKDLVRNKNSAISTFRSICETLLPFIIDVTGIPLNTKIDLFCSQYKYTDTLLCHDDELEERRVAFIYYLVPETWSSCDGGCLDLFDTDEHGQPNKIVKSILPKRNSFAFFEVSSKSFHQVAEILSEDKTRLSISGWFHGPKLSRPAPYSEALPPAIPYGSIEEDIFYSWFNPLYLAPEVQSDIRKRFEEDSEILLTDFLQPEKYDELVTALRSSSISWNLLGPANKRQYYEAEKKEIPPILAEYLRVIQSDAVFLVLSNLTGLSLHSMAVESENESGDGAGPSASNGGVVNPRCRTEVRKWEHGCYTLSHDTDSEMFEFALDSMLYIDCCKDWSCENGGYTSYIVKGEDEELLSVEPLSNCLALVYRDKSTMRFVKHLNHRMTKLSSPKFYEINVVYYE